MPGNRVSTFPLATKVVVTVTTKLAIPKGHRASDVVGVGGNARLARGDEGGVAREDGWHGGCRVKGCDINSHNILRGGI